MYKSALALRILFYFLYSLYIYSSPYLIRDTYDRLIKYITFGVLLCVTHSDHLAIPTKKEGINLLSSIFVVFLVSRITLIANSAFLYLFRNIIKVISYAKLVSCLILTKKYKSKRGKDLTL